MSFPLQEDVPREPVLPGRNNAIFKGAGKGLTIFRGVGAICHSFRPVRSCGRSNQHLSCQGEVLGRLRLRNRNASDPFTYETKSET